MNKRFLKKHIYSLSRQGLAENLLPISKSYKKKLIRHPQYTATTQLTLKRRRDSNNTNRMLLHQGRKARLEIKKKLLFNVPINSSRRIKRIQERLLSQFLYKEKASNMTNVSSLPLSIAYSLPMLQQASTKEIIKRKIGFAFDLHSQIDQQTTLNTNTLAFDSPNECIDNIGEKGIKRDNRENAPNLIKRNGEIYSPALITKNKDKQEKRQKNYLDLVPHQHHHFVPRTGQKSQFINKLFSVDQIRNEISMGLPGSKERQKRNYSQFLYQIRECRKIRYLYGYLSRSQLKKVVLKAKQLPGTTADNLLLLLESRLDCVLQRCAFFPTIKAARQYITHKGVLINSKKVYQSCFQLSPGDVIRVVTMDLPTTTTKNTEKKSLVPIGIGKFVPLQVQLNKSGLNSLNNTKAVSEYSYSHTYGNISTMLTKNILLLSHYITKITSTTNFLSYKSIEINKNQQRVKVNATKTQDRENLLEKIASLLFPKIKNRSIRKKKHPTLMYALRKKMKTSFTTPNQDKHPLILLKLNQLNQNSISNNINTNTRGRLEKNQLIGKIHKKLIILGRKFDAYLKKQKNRLQVLPCNVTNLNILSSSSQFFLYIIYIHLIYVKKILLCFENINYKRKKNNNFKTLNKHNIKTLNNHIDTRVLSVKSGQTKDTLHQEEKLIDEKEPFNGDLQYSLNGIKECTTFYQKKSRGLHIEVSYRSLSAIFLYPPQRIYLPAIIDCNTVVKTFLRSKSR